MRKLEEKYQRELVVVGVEAGKFRAERVTANIREAVLRLEVEHPVVNDRHFRIWRSYAVSAWPTLALVDPEGYLRGTHAGEMTFDAFDPLIARLVQEYDRRGRLDRAPLPYLRPERLGEPQRPLAYPGKVLATPDGRLFIADSNHNRVLVVSLDREGDGGQVTVVIGRGDAAPRDGDFGGAAFYHPQGMALDGEVLYVADSENHAIRAVDLRRGMVRTIAGTGAQAHQHNLSGPASRVPLSSPWDVAVAGGSLYIAMAGTHQIYRLDLTSGAVQPYAGSGREDIADGGLAASALAQPMGLTVGSGRLYFADSESSAVRWADLPPGKAVGTVTGTGLFDFGDKDGVGAAVRMQHVQGIAWDGDRLYVADTYNHKIKVVAPATRQASTLLGDGTAGYRDGEAAQFYEPGGVSVAGEKLYIADTNNHVIRVADRRTGRVAALEPRF